MPEELRIPVSQFKARCLRLMEEVGNNRLRLLVTKRGKPLARIEPPDRETAKIHGWLRGSVKITGDLTEPTGTDWDALEDGS